MVFTPPLLFIQMFCNLVGKCYYKYKNQLPGLDRKRVSNPAQLVTSDSHEWGLAGHIWTFLYLVYPTSSWQTAVQSIFEPELIYNDIFSISEFMFINEPVFAFVSTVSCDNEFHNLIMKCMKKLFLLFFWFSFKSSFWSCYFRPLFLGHHG